MPAVTQPQKPPRGVPSVSNTRILNRTGTQDDGFVFMPLRTLQAIFELPGKIVVVLVRATRVDAASLHRVTQGLRALGGNMNIFPLSELLNNASQLMQVTRVFVLAIVAVAVAIGAVGVLNTVLMAVFERTKEIGMMKAVGASGRDIFELIWVETVLVCAAGGVLGIGLAIVSARGIEWFLRQALASQFTAYRSDSRRQLRGVSYVGTGNGNRDNAGGR